jgi:hypothetical protein
MAAKKLEPTIVTATAGRRTQLNFLITDRLTTLIFELIRHG